MYATPRIAISPASVEEATGDITLVVNVEPNDLGKFPPHSVVTINGTGEGYVPDTTLSGPRSLTVTVPNDTRAVADYAVQVRFQDARVTSPATLTITAAPPP